MPNPNLIVLVVAAGVLALVWWRSRRENFESAEERKQRKVAEAKAKLMAISPANRPDDWTAAFNEYRTRFVTAPIGYADRLKGKLGIKVSGLTHMNNNLFTAQANRDLDADLAASNRW